MSQKYFRQFITLVSDKKNGFGKVLLEGKGDIGKAALTLSGIANGGYRLILFGIRDEKNIGVDIGLVIILEKGQAEERFEFARGDIARGGLTLEDVKGAALVALHDKQDKQQGKVMFTTVLHGHTKQPYPWEFGLLFHQYIQDEPAFPPEGTLKEILEKSQNKMAASTPHHVEEVPASVYSVDHFEKEHKEIAAPPSPAKASVEDFFHLSNHVNVFADGDEGVAWVATSLLDLQGLEIDHVKNLGEDNFIVASEEKYRHIILGREAASEGFSYMIGVPDVYSGENLPNLQGRFDYFKPCNQTEHLDDQHGYWVKRL